ncbi:MAG: hypothetical protein A2X94_06845 [Bdellovibrionales bacterium GWB1_55_8]|nr:MAG: hypothetical protein A2X94_06845 [Bdellovibrionales bacterium GWB1_55_8]
MLIIVNGTVGVGKTWVARTLLCQLDDAAYIEGDVLGFVSDNLIATQSRQKLALNVACDLISAYRRLGARTIVFDSLFLSPDLMEDFIQRVGEPARVFYLSAETRSLSARILKRGRPQAEREVSETQEVERNQRGRFLNGALGFEIKTDNMSPDEIADLIKKKAFE